MCSPHLGARACAARRVGASPLSASTLHPTGGAPHTQLINLAAGSERSTQDARCLGLAGFDPEARARAAQPKRGRQPARPTRLSRGVAAVATKKVAKILITFPPTAKGGAAKGGAAKGGARRRKSGAAEPPLLTPPPNRVSDERYLISSLTDEQIDFIPELPVEQTDRGSTPR